MNERLRCTRGWIMGAILLVALAAIADSTSADDVTAGDIPGTLSLEKLVQQLDSAPRPRRWTASDGKATYDSILAEIIRRGGEAAESILASKLANRSMPENLELLTALRRVQKQPDPLAVTVDGAPQIKAGTRKLPILNVAIENVDLEKRDVGFKFGGDNRSGRHDRWRIHVWDSNGKLLPERARWSVVAGGVFQTGPLSFGKTWKAHLALASYVSIRSPGKYKVQVLYHNVAVIADIENPKDLEGLILFQSEPFELNVEPGPKVVIQLQAGSNESTMKLLKLLDEDDEVCLLLDDYDKEAHDFVDPKSPQGQILTMNWQAVPCLLDSLQDEKVSFQKRAWVLALLMSIVRERDLDPATRSGVLPAYRYRGTLNTWVTSQSGASGGYARGSASGGRENVVEQLNLAKEWLKFRDDCLDIQVEK
jgi:hypothetical protein